jgi:hypothetical protein
MGITTYILIGAIFGFTCTWGVNRVSKMKEWPPQILREFGWVEHLAMILLWPLCITIVLYAFIREIYRQWPK